MLWIGLTGGIACGKSTVSRLIRSKGFAVVDADELAKEVVRVGTPAYGDIQQAFGPEVVDSSGLKRREIAEIVFKDPLRLRKLEEIIHPRVRELARQKRLELEGKNLPMAFYDVPLLFETKMESGFDQIVVVACSEKVQLQRLIARDQLSVEQANARLRAQLPLTEKIKRAHEIIFTEGSLADLERDVSDVLARLLRSSQK